MRDYLVDDNENLIGAPVKGIVFDCSDLDDPTFAQGILGEGVAIYPVEGKVYSPVDGEIQMVMESKHAVSMEADCGTELLVHVGLDTVNLKGEHFKSYVSTGDKVKKGDLLIEFDMDALKAEGYDVSTIVVVCNSYDYNNIEKNIGKKVGVGNAIISVKKDNKGLTGETNLFIIENAYALLKKLFNVKGEERL
ncbi:MAG: PTS glucose transporter subunit IIA [Lachnospiraceae bacterium]|nr:PTS glucose transporter subunit IIA [Lachnospiraceae bacterium]